MNLARLLRSDYGIYALHSRGLDLAETPQQNVGEIARSYLADVLAEIPEGPYAFAGWSFGGFVAAAMGARLAAESGNAPLLVMFDVGPEHQMRIPATQGPALGLLIHAVRLDNAAGEIIDLPASERLVTILKMAQRRAALPETFATAHVERMVELNAVHLAAMADYHFPPTASDVLLFRAAETSGSDHIPGAALGWEHLSAGRVDVHVLPGTHFEILDRRHHGAIARHLHAALARRSL